MLLRKDGEQDKSLERKENTSKGERKKTGRCMDSLYLKQKIKWSEKKKGKGGGRKGMGRQKRIRNLDS